ncbi:flagellar motor switch phosphatase FliY [Cohnella luojiensis]|uniref:Flagellar motor switch phosphatase FliY n=1 Tax=Cohnella luojiensis TaxID=652876 RepID=A0A4Y8LU35_9BACL|nr:flagellar motor switch phosphatase FliY [Cohnella luojiensis]TFE24419.1 flagellar motor switch phosphatase FliY [Cohnella luojiensis]
MTSKDYLSQEEIDALLRQSSVGDDETSSASVVGERSINDYLTPLEQDALGEIGNITFGSAATALSTLLGKKVDITTPTVSTIEREQFEAEFPKPHVAVHVSYVEGFEGINSLVIKSHDAQVIADLMLGGEGNVTSDELNEIHVSAVQEAMNQMMGSSATSMSTIFNRMVNISPPGIDIMDVRNNSGTNNIPQESVFVKISFRLKIGDLIDSSIMQLISVPFAKEMVGLLMGSVSEENAPQATQAQPATQPAAQPVQQPQPANAPPVHQAPPMASAPPSYAAPMPSYPQTLGGGVNRNVNVNPVQFANFQGGGFTQGDETNLNLLLDIPLKVTVELGRTQKQIKDILELSQGSIIELDKLAGEPVDILVNNKLIAKGEVVVIDENFGVRVTDIVSQWDRVQKIQ